MVSNKAIADAMTIRLDQVVNELPPMPQFVDGTRRALKERLPSLLRRPSLP